MAKKFDFLSPGIEIREIDQSFLPQEAEALGPIIIGRTRKGPQTQQHTAYSSLLQALQTKIKPDH